MPNGANPWKLENFAERFDAWADLESPDGDLRCVVLAWVLTRGDDPSEGVRREPDFENLWFGAVPDSQHGSGHVVTCSYRCSGRRRCSSVDREVLQAGGTVPMKLTSGAWLTRTPETFSASCSQLTPLLSPSALTCCSAMLDLKPQQARDSDFSRSSSGPLDILASSWPPPPWHPRSTTPRSARSRPPTSQRC